MLSLKLFLRSNVQVNLLISSPLVSPPQHPLAWPLWVSPLSLSLSLVPTDTLYTGKHASKDKCEDLCLGFGASPSKILSSLKKKIGQIETMTLYLLLTIQHHTVRTERNTDELKNVCDSTPQWSPDYLQMCSGGLAECGGSLWHAAHMIKSVIVLQFKDALSLDFEWVSLQYCHTMQSDRAALKSAAWSPCAILTKSPLVVTLRIWVRYVTGLRKAQRGPLP